MQLDAASFATLVSDGETIGSSLSAEISVKLSAMWCQLPLKIFGFWGEQVGYSTAVVNRFIQDTMDEYAKIENKLAVHRVARGYLAETSDVAITLMLKVTRGLPLVQFRYLYMKVRGHASSLICSRRNEGDHRNLKIISRPTTNVSAPLLMARLRAPDLAPQLKQGTFISFCAKHWPARGRHSVVHQLLAHRFPAWKINELSWHQRCLHVYGCASSDIFEDTADVHRAVVAFKLAQPSVSRELLTTLEDAIVTRLVSVLPTGAIGSMPRDIFSAGRAGAEEAIRFRDVVGALFHDTLPQHHLEQSDVVFLEVGNQTGSMVLAVASHVAQPKLVRFQVLSVCPEVDTDGSCVWLERTGEVGNADLLEWVRSSALPTLLQTLASWKVSDSTVHVAPKRPRLLVDRIADVQPAICMQGVADHAHAGVAVDDLALESFVPGREESAMQQLLDFAAADDQPINSWASALDFPNVHVDTLELLRAQGFVESTLCEFGTTKWALSTGASQLRSRLSVRFQGLLPRRDIASTGVHPSMSKLEIIAICLSNGWEIGDLPKSFKPKGAKYFNEGILAASKWMLIAFASLDRIFAVGVNIVYSGMPAKYFEYLCRLTDATSLNAYGKQVEKWGHKVWLNILDGREPHAVVPQHLLDGLAEEESEPDELVPHEVVAAAAAAVPLSLRADMTPERVRPPVVFSGLFEAEEEVNISFDGESHASGPRAYVSCKRHRADACRKYRFLHDFECLADCVIWLAAWKVDSFQCIDKPQHRDHQPTSGSMTLARQHLPRLL